MKSYKLVYLVALTATAFSLVGCRKGLQGTTPLPGYGMTKAPGSDEKPGLPIDSAPPIDRSKPLLGTGEIGVPLSDTMKDWKPSAEQPFKSDTVYFDYDKSTIKASETPKLDHVASEMKQHHHGKGLRIEGHCDERGTEEYNRSLGDRRALSIREYLIRAGINAQLVDTVSYGEDRPTESGHTESAWSKNRRGEFIMLEPPK